MANFMNIKESDGTVTVNVTESLTVDNNEVLTDVDFGTTAGTVAEGNHSHSGIYEPVITKGTAFNKDFGTATGTVSEGNHSHGEISADILDDQTIDSDIGANSAVYFNKQKALWQKYKPGTNKVPCLYMGGTQVALNGAIVTLNHNGDNLYLDDEGELSTYMNLKTKNVESLGYRIGDNSFKIEYRKSSAHQEKIQASDKTAGMSFGSSVSMYDTFAIVGATSRYVGSAKAGSAFIYRFNGITWVEESILTASDAQSYDWFGNEVSISDNVAIVGAAGEDTGGDRAGAAYIFRYNGLQWTQEAKIQASDKQATDYFGSSVAIDHDIAVVGAHYEDTGANNAGAAYIYMYDGSSWSSGIKVQASDLSSGANFGESVDVYGNCIVVGAPQKGGYSGGAYIYRYDGSAWIEEAIITATGYDRVGSSVSIYDDTIILGTTGGNAYVYRYDGSDWVLEATLINHDSAPNDYYGFAVSIYEDIALVSARNGSIESYNGGAVYLYRYNGTTWVEEAKLQSCDLEASDYFGNSISLHEKGVFIGTYLEDTGGENAGSAYYFDLSVV